MLKRTMYFVCTRKAAWTGYPTHWQTGVETSISCFATRVLARPGKHTNQNNQVENHKMEAASLVHTENVRILLWGVWGVELPKTKRAVWGAADPSGRVWEREAPN